MQRWAILLCVFLLLGVVGSICLAAPESGMVLAPCDSVNIVRTGGQTVSCHKGEVLFEGDHLIGTGAAKVPVRWYNDARAKIISPDEVQVEVYRPSKIKQLIDNILEFLGLRGIWGGSVSMVSYSTNPADDPQPNPQTLSSPIYRILAVSAVFCLFLGFAFWKRRRK